MDPVVTFWTAFGLTVLFAGLGFTARGALWTLVALVVVGNALGIFA